jgi:hypothetical protein
MEQHTLKVVQDCWNTNISFYLETSGVKALIYIQILFIFSMPVLIRNQLHLKTVVFLHRSITCCSTMPHSTYYILDDLPLVDLDNLSCSRFYFLNYLSLSITTEKPLNATFE